VAHITPAAVPESLSRLCSDRFRDSIGSESEMPANWDRISMRLVSESGEQLTTGKTVPTPGSWCDCQERLAFYLTK
jgi:hypothetical protein